MLIKIQAEHNGVPLQHSRMGHTRGCCGALIGFNFNYNINQMYSKPADEMKRFTLAFDIVGCIIFCEFAVASG